MSEVYTICSLAALLEVTPRTIAGEIRRGELQAVKQRGRWEISQAQLEDYLERHTQPATRTFTPEEIQRNRRRFEQARRNRQRQ